MSLSEVIPAGARLPDLAWLLQLVLGVLLAAAVFLFYARRQLSLPTILGRLSLAAMAVRVIFAAVLTAAQYYVWSNGEFTRYLLEAPLSPEVPAPAVVISLLDGRLGYFWFFASGRFWLNALISILVAAGFYAVLRLIHRYRRRLFHPGELELGLLTAVAVGWPKVVVFIPLGLLLVVMFSVFRLVVMKQPYTSLAEPLLLSALITMFLGDPLVTMLDLGTLRV